MYKGKDKLVVRLILLSVCTIICFLGIPSHQVLADSVADTGDPSYQSEAPVGDVAVKAKLGRGFGKGHSNRGNGMLHWMAEGNENCLSKPGRGWSELDSEWKDDRDARIEAWKNMDPAEREQLMAQHRENCDSDTGECPGRPDMTEWKEKRDQMLADRKQKMDEYKAKCESGEIECPQRPNMEEWRQERDKWQADREVIDAFVEQTKQTVQTTLESIGYEDRDALTAAIEQLRVELEPQVVAFVQSLALENTEHNEHFVEMLLNQILPKHGRGLGFKKQMEDGKQKKDPSQPDIDQEAIEAFMEQARQTVETALASIGPDDKDALEAAIAQLRIELEPQVLAFVQSLEIEGTEHIENFVEMMLTRILSKHRRGLGFKKQCASDSGNCDQE